MKKWWTSGSGTGTHWVWTMRLSTQEFFFKFWADDRRSIETSPSRDSCVVLDADYFYQWKKVKCTTRHQTRTQRESQQLPSHHFICQQRPLEPERLLVETPRPRTIKSDSGVTEAESST